MARVVIYSDQPILAIGLQSVVAADPELRLTACCTNLAQLKQQLVDAHPDVAVVDFTPQIEAATLHDLQNLAGNCKLILWTTSIAADFTLRALTIGIRGILRKTLPLEAHRQCLHRVYRGELWFEKRLTDAFRTPKYVALSRRESQLITLLSRGLRNKEISAELDITEGTVKVYLSHLFRKCGAKNRFDMAMYGRQNLSLAGNSLDGQGDMRCLVMGI